MAVRVITDSTSYIPPDEAEALGIRVVQLSATLDGVTRTEDEIDPESFYRAMLASPQFPTSSQPSVASIIEAMEEPVAAGDEVVAVLLSSKMSGTYETALMARDQVLARHPSAGIAVVDSLSNCMEEGFAVLAAARVADDDGTLADVVAAARKTTARTRWLFSPASLEYLRMGGRIGNARALLGTLLQVRPILTVIDGVTATVRSVRTQRRAVETIADMVASDAEAHGLVDIVVHHILAAPEAEVLAKLLGERIGRRPRVQQIGPAIGLHVGPGTLGVVYETREELHKNAPLQQ
jgi:DegV family protein with EDD domain